MSFSSFKKDQMIFENFRKFVNEEGEEERDKGFFPALSWGAKYVAFVAALGQNAKDPKVRAFLEAGIQDKDGNPDDDKFDFQENVAIPVAKLQPTQNEVDIDKSLSFPLIKTGGKGFVKNNTASGPITVGSPIVTFNGEYVIDGHHRWSQLYACNKNAEIVALNITLEGIEALDALKAVQAAIALQTGAVPTNKVEGSNLFTMSGNDIARWIKSKVPADSIKVIASSEPVVQKMRGGFNEEAMKMAMVQALLAKYVWSNVATMQKRSPPVDGAGPRDYMPQTDNVNWRDPLEKGVIDIAEPHGKIAAESKGSQTMKITKARLEEIVKEELKAIMSEDLGITGGDRYSFKNRHSKGVPDLEGRLKKVTRGQMEMTAHDWVESGWLKLTDDQIDNMSDEELIDALDAARNKIADQRAAQRRDPQRNVGYPQR